MSTPMYELEFEDEFEGEFEIEGEWEGEDEAEEFFGRLASLARRAAGSPALRRIGLTAARSALRGLSGVGGRIGGAAGRQIGGQVADILGGYLPQSEFEGEFETEIEGEDEMFVNPRQAAQTAALMAHLGHAAASAESEDETEAFLGALIPLAARLVPRVAPTIMRAAPQLVRGLSNVGRTLINNPTARPLINALPAVARNTAASIARQVASGRPVTPQTAVRTLARQTANVLGSPQRAVNAYRQTRRLDRRYHRGGAGAAAGAAGAGITAGGDGIAADQPGSCQCAGQAMY